MREVVSERVRKRGQRVCVGEGGLGEWRELKERGREKEKGGGGEEDSGDIRRW